MREETLYIWKFCERIPTYIIICMSVYICVYLGGYDGMFIKKIIWIYV